MKKIKGHLSAIADLFDSVQILIDNNNPSFTDRVSELRASIEDLREDLEESEDKINTKEVAKEISSNMLICNFELGIDNCGFQPKDIFTCKYLRKCDKCGN